MSIKKSRGEKVFDVVNTIIMIFLMIITLYPLMYVFFSSISDPAKLMSHQGILFGPAGFSLEGYKLVLKNPLIASGYMNTIFYVVVGTTLNILMTSSLAYALSRKNTFWGKYIMLFVVITMFFGGGLIPSYLLIKNLGLIDSRWALILPGLIGTWNLIIMRTSFMGIPESLQEAAKIDGANDITILFRIILPLSKATIAVMVLFYGVGHWNSWFNAMLYLRDKELYPLQLILREILIEQSNDEMMIQVSGERVAIEEVVKYATIMVATVPILVLYPFLQKYFVKGVMIGSLKG